ncbi:MAG: hypothetical protein ACLGIJ_08470 [Candidatus Limnocylindria bacterium]
MTLREVLDAAAAADGAPVTAEGSDGATTWAIEGVVFATLDRSGTTASFRLDPVLAGAARRTPDTGASFLGPEWVEFRPALVDDHAADRAEAWFAAALRRAEPGFRA